MVVAVCAECRVRSEVIFKREGHVSRPAWINSRCVHAANPTTFRAIAFEGGRSLASAC